VRHSEKKHTNFIRKSVQNRLNGRDLINSPTAATVNVIARTFIRLLLLLYRLLHLILPLHDRRALYFSYRV